LYWVVTFTAQKVGRIIRCFTARTVGRVGAVFRFKFLGGEKVVNVFENEFVTMGRIADRVQL
jgi:hypothetical protein